MKKFFFSFKIFAVITLMVLGCIGCGQNTSESMDLAVVYGSRSNEPNIPITTAPTVKMQFLRLAMPMEKSVSCDAMEFLKLYTRQQYLIRKSKGFPKVRRNLLLMDILISCWRN